MNNSEDLFLPIDEGEFVRKDVCGIFQKLMCEYNKIIKKDVIDESDLIFSVEQIIIYASGGVCLNEIAQSMVILLLAIDKRDNSESVGLDGASIAFNCGDLEICRELVIFAIKKSSIEDVRNTNREFIKLSKEDKEQNVADILGMVVEELERNNRIDEKKYKSLLNDFAKPLEEWRNLEVPKSQHEGSYDLIYQIIEVCYRNKAYHTALRLSGLLFISDQTKREENLSHSLFLIGKITYELGHLEVAKRCFLFADEDTKGECWNSEDKQYNALLGQETELVLTDEIMKKDRQLQEKADRGEIKLYTSIEVDMDLCQYIGHKKSNIFYAA